MKRALVAAVLCLSLLAPSRAGASVMRPASSPNRCGFDGSSWYCFQILGRGRYVTQFRGSVENIGYRWPVYYWVEVTGPGYNTGALEIGPIGQFQTDTWWRGVNSNLNPGRYCVAIWTPWTFVGGACANVY